MARKEFTALAENTSVLESLNTVQLPEVAQAVRGRVSITLTGDHTLTSAQAKNGFLDLTGALGSPAVVTIPTEENRFEIRNESGATVTVKVSGQVSGIPSIADGATGVVRCDGTAALSIGGSGGGSGDVVGPASSTDNHLAAYDGTTGKLLKGSGVAVSTDGTMAANSAALVPAQSAVVTFVNAAIAAVRDGVSSAFDTLAEIATELALKAPLASPNLTGTPLSTTAAADTNTTQIATTAFVIGQAGANTPQAPGTAAVGTSKKYSREDHVHAAIALGRPESATETLFNVPGVAFNTSPTTETLANTRLLYFPFRVEAPITLDRLWCEVSTPGAGGTLIRMGIYNANADLQPMTLIVDAGTIPADASGVATLTISQTLQPGVYLFAMHTNSAATVRAMPGACDIIGINPAMGASSLLLRMYVATAFGALASTGVAWDTTSYSTTGLRYCMGCRVA